MEVRKSVCRLCKADCGILVHVNEHGKAVFVEGDPESPLNRGALCARGNAALQMVYDHDRVLRPLKRQGGRMVEVDWEDALDEIADRLLHLRDKYGPATLATYEGASFSRLNTQAYITRFLNYYGSPNHTGTESICVGPKYVAGYTTFGQVPVGDFRQAKAIILLGTNPAVTGVHRYLRAADDILSAKEAGAKLVVIDPIFSETAAKADLWVPIRPATDLALVLGLIRLVIEEGWYDRSFVERYTYGFEQLAAAVKKYTLDYVSRITGVSPDTIVEIARIYTSQRPAVIDKREGCMHNSQATQTNRAILILAALGGNVDVTGGLVFNPNLPLNRGVLAAERRNSEVIFFAGPDFHWGDITGLLPDAILNDRPYPIRALIVTAGNPVMAWPNTKKVLAALRKLELLVVIDIYESETAQEAHFLLPGVTPLERTDLCMNNLMPVPLIRLSQKVIEPVGQAWPEWKIFNELGRRLFGPDFTFESEGEFLDSLLAGSGYNYKLLEENPNGFIYQDLPVGKLLREGFPTPSGKIELYSTTLGRFGFSPLPEYEDKQPLGDDWPYRLLSGSRLPMYNHSTLMNIPWLKGLYPRQWAEISADISLKLGVKDGDMVKVSTPRGELELPVKIMPASAPGVVLIRHGFGHTGFGRTARQDPGENVNYLTEDLIMDPIAGTPVYRELYCRVEKVKEGESHGPA